MTSDASPPADPCVRLAAEMAARTDGAMVVLSVLSGSIARGVPPLEAGRRRRAAEDAAKSALAEQLARTAPEAPADVIALFGDVAVDTLLLARNLHADVVVVPATSPGLEELIRTSPIPVLVVPSG